MPAPARRHAPAAAAAFWVLAAGLLAACVLQPQWPVQFVSGLLWFAGAWRAVAVPAALALAGALLVANWRRPGGSWAALRRACAPGGVLRAVLPGSLAVLIGLAAVGYTAGLLSWGRLAKALLLLALQVGLFPGTPLLVLLAALTAVVLWADARGQQASVVGQAGWRRLAPGASGGLGAARRALPGVATAAGGAALAAAIFPAAMQGWGHADGADGQRFSFYSSFFNHSFVDTGVERSEGYETGRFGLVLPAGGSGSIVFRLQRVPGSLVLLKANFYNRCFEGPPACPDPVPFPNALEVSTDGGQSWAVVFKDASVGQVVGDQALDLSPFLGGSRAYWLRFQATNTTDRPATVLPSLVVSVVADPLAVPDPAFPVVAYAAGAALLGYAAARRHGVALGGAVPAGLAGATLLAVAAAAGVRFAPSGQPEASGIGSLPIFDPTGGPEARAILAITRLAFAALAVVVLGLLVWRAAGADEGRRTKDEATSVVRRSSFVQRPGRWTGVLGLAVLLVVLVAIDARWGRLVQLRHELLLPDAQGYQAIAVELPRKLAHYGTERPSALLDELNAAGFDGRASVPAVFYAGGNNGREPLWPATLRLVFNILGVSAFHTRLTSLALGVGVAALTCWLGWRAVHPVVGVTGGLLVALSATHVDNSVAGLREELVTVLLLLVAGALFVGWRGRAAVPAASTVTPPPVTETLFAGWRRRAAVPWWRPVAAGTAAAAVVLTRADMVVLAGALLTLGALVLRWPWRAWLAAVVVMGALAGPMYVGYSFTHGDPFYPGTYGATVNRNLEFPERMGTPGFPSPEAYAANWAAGPMISPMQYFFGYHSPAQFVEYSVRGFGRIFSGILFRDQPVVLALFAAGMAAFVVGRRWLVPGLVVVSLVPFYAFLAGVPNPWVFPSRYAHHVLPFAALAAAYGLWCLPLWLTTLVQRTRRWQTT